MSSQTIFVVAIFLYMAGVYGWIYYDLTRQIKEIEAAK